MQQCHDFKADNHRHDADEDVDGSAPFHQCIKEIQQQSNQKDIQNVQDTNLNKCAYHQVNHNV